MSRASERRAARLARKEARLAAKAARQVNRQGNRSERAYGRQNVRSTAYETGQNPNAFISDIVSTVGATAVGLKGGSQTLPPGKGVQGKSGGGDFMETVKDNPLPYAAGALAAVVLAKKAKLF